MLRHVKDVAVHSKGTLYMKLAFWLHCIEITSLCGVTYISNRENYSEYIVHNCENDAISIVMTWQFHPY